MAVLRLHVPGILKVKGQSHVATEIHVYTTLVGNATEKKTIKVAVVVLLNFKPCQSLSPSEAESGGDHWRMWPHLEGYLETGQLHIDSIWLTYAKMLER